MSACRDFRDLLSAHLDGALAPAEAKALEDHLASCPGCAKALEELRRTVEAIRSLEPVEPPPWLAERILARVQPRKRPLFLRPELQAAALVLVCLTGLLVAKVAGPGSRMVPEPRKESKPAEAVQEKAEEPAQQAPARKKKVEDGFAPPPGPASTPVTGTPGADTSPEPSQAPSQYSSQAPSQAPAQAPPRAPSQAAPTFLAPGIVGSAQAPRAAEAQAQAGNAARDMAPARKAESRKAESKKAAESYQEAPLAAPLRFRLEAADSPKLRQAVLDAILACEGVPQAPALERSVTARMESRRLPRLRAALERLGRLEGPTPLDLPDEVLVTISW